MQNLLITKIKFQLCRFIKKQLEKNGDKGLDNQYWHENGWINKSRPWKK